ncbi:hypothetical protein CHUAL_002688 [Chamberlinius hualienensis]
MKIILKDGNLFRRIGPIHQQDSSYGLKGWNDYLQVCFGMENCLLHWTHLSGGLILWSESVEWT